MVLATVFVATIATASTVAVGAAPATASLVLGATVSLLRSLIAGPVVVGPLIPLVALRRVARGFARIVSVIPVVLGPGRGAWL